MLSRPLYLVFPILILAVFFYNFGGEPESGSDNDFGSWTQGNEEAQDPLAITPELINDEEPLIDNSRHREIFSLTTKSKKYFEVQMGRYPSYNPNILPHPSRKDVWIVVAQHEKSKAKDPVFYQLVCNAAFMGDKLACLEPPTILPYAGTNRPYKDVKEGRACPKKLNFLNFNVGPHDARVFFGPDAPYTTFGSNSGIICFAQWVQDFRSLFGVWDSKPPTIDIFADETELQRPGKLPENALSLVEKNWFMFWDLQGKPYVHHDTAPKRVFAEVNADGSSGPNLAPQAAMMDNTCMERWMPKPGPELEDIHQATNSLSITLCNRDECVPDEDNTFIMSIFHYKTFHDMHGLYEPYVMLFKQRAPFELYGISEKALWIHGRAPFNEAAAKKVHKWKDFKEEDLPKNHTEMVFMTSMNWKEKGQKYHGFENDVIFLGFGVEDARGGAIDVKASDLLQDLRHCGETPA